MGIDKEVTKTVKKVTTWLPKGDRNRKEVTYPLLRTPFWHAEKIDLVNVGWGGGGANLPVIMSTSCRLGSSKGTFPKWAALCSAGPKGGQRGTSFGERGWGPEVHG